MSLLEDLENFVLNKGGKKKSGLRKTTFELPQGTLTSWKFNDWDYYRRDLPIHARGLFLDGDKIVVRGYNKFFNIDETPETKWESIAKTHGPYECTSKENGCIVFIAAYNGELIVTSKHSVGTRDELTKNHSVAGLNWVRKHLAQAGVPEAELVRELEANNWTAVGELCDDSFEEHVLSYDTPGIYLTGLNENVRELKTRPFGEVQEFARRFGFIVTDFCQFDSLSEMRTFVDKCAETGSWNGREIEGFVVRCKTNSGTTFFFKYKFEEPYFMYRQWREATKQYIKDPTTMPRMHARHAASCQKYLEFAARYINVHPELKESIPEGKGIIELRKKFIETGVDENALLAMGLNDLQKKYVLVPVATIGCGKTTVAMALQELTGCALAQNDDIPSGKSKQTAMIRRCMELMESNNLLFFDRNNHQRRERAQLFKDLGAAAGIRGWKLVYICLNFLPYGPGNKSWEITTKRVVARGDNHQTITGMPPKMIEGIMKGFVGRFEPVVAGKAPDDEFDSIVDLDVAKGSKENVLRVLAKLKEYDDIEINSSLNNSSLDVAAAMAKALAYKGKAIVAPTTISKLVQYFAVQVNPAELQDVALPEGYTRLNEFHVTVAHQKSHAKEFKEAKAKYAAKLDTPYTAKNKVAKTVDLDVPVTVIVKSLCQNKRVVALSVECSLSKNKHPHITMGLAPKARPQESNDMLENPESSREVHKVLQGRLLAYL